MMWKFLLPAGLVQEERLRACRELAAVRRLTGEFYNRRRKEMPNWVHHKLTITGPEIERERFMAECFSKDDEGVRFDFNKLIPQPDEIRRNRGVVDDPADDFPAWYRWCCENWGTKWNACRTTIVRKSDAIDLLFDTWSPPIPNFNAVAARFPKLRIEGSFTEEMGDFGADVLCQNGNVEFEDRTEEVRRAFEAAMGSTTMMTGWVYQTQWMRTLGIPPITSWLVGWLVIPIEKFLVRRKRKRQEEADADIPF
jgi:hypothetical protein